MVVNEAMEDKKCSSWSFVVCVCVFVDGSIHVDVKPDSRTGLTQLIFVLAPQRPLDRRDLLDLSKSSAAKTKTRTKTRLLLLLSLVCRDLNRSCTTTVATSSSIPSLDD